MNLRTGLPKLSAVATLIAFSVTASGSTPTLDEVWQLVQKQQSQIENLQNDLIASQRRLEEAQTRLQSQNSSNESRIAQTETALELTADAIESAAFQSDSSGTTIGGYGELHYNNLDSGDQADFHRFVLLFSHEFSDALSFHSELEIEHALSGNGKPGEVEIEQAYIQWDYSDNHHSKMGLALVPVGILNETHEPDTFFGVERNGVEKNIIPATWWEAGVGLSGEFSPGWSYDVMAHTGLRLDMDNSSPSKRSNIRSARQKVAKAEAENLAYTARLKYAGFQGFQWSTSFQYQSDLTQNDADGLGLPEIDATLFETNLSYRNGGFGLRALYARWDIDDEIELLNTGADEQEGWYLEPSYRFESGLGLFMRYSSYDLTAGESAASDEKNQFDIGLNYWLHENVVLKADFQRQDNDNGDDIDGFNLGVGYSF